MRQGAPEPIQFPDDEAIARLDIGQGLPEPGALIASATGVITELDFIHFCGVKNSCATMA